MSESSDKRNSSLTRRHLLAAGAATGGVLSRPTVFSPAIAQSGAIKVGVLAPLSGVYASLGTNKVNGIKMLFTEKGMKVGGRTIEMTIEDTEAKPQEGLRKARKLVEQDNVDILLGVISSAIGYALKDYVGRAKKVWVTTGAAADGIFKKANNNPYAFRSSLSTWQANDPMGTWLGEKGFKRVFITGPDYAMGREALEAFDRTFKVKGATRAGEAYPQLGTTDFAPYLAEIKRANPDLVYASFAGSDAVRFVQQYASFGLKGAIQLAGYGYLAEEDTFEAQGAAVEGVFSTLNWAYGIDTPLNKAFVQGFQAKHGRVPTDNEGQAYNGVRTIFEGVKLAKSVKPGDVAKALRGASYDTVYGKVTMRAADNQQVMGNYIGQVKKVDGKLRPVIERSFPASLTPPPSADCKM